LHQTKKAESVSNITLNVKSGNSYEEYQCNAAMGGVCITYTVSVFFSATLELTASITTIDDSVSSFFRRLSRVCQDAEF
jgi:hypothetical protein